MSKIFTIQEEIGRGSFAVVYKGLYNNQPVAIKKILAEKDSLHYRYINTELEILERLSHKNIVKLLKRSKGKTHFYIVTELCLGKDLKSYLETHNYLEARIAKRLFKELLEVLIYLRNQKVIHRDIKPANILLTSENIEESSFKLIDFGLSVEITQSLALSSVGSPLYMAPEVMEFEGCTFKADTWSMGVVFYEMLFGVLPFWGSSISELLKKQKQGLRYPVHENVDLWARELLQRMLVINPDDRSDYEDLLELNFFKEDFKDMMNSGVESKIGVLQFGELREDNRRALMREYLRAITTFDEYEREEIKGVEEIESPNYEELEKQEVSCGEEDFGETGVGEMVEVAEDKEANKELEDFFAVVEKGRVRLDELIQLVEELVFNGKDYLAECAVNYFEIQYNELLKYVNDLVASSEEKDIRKISMKYDELELMFGEIVESYHTVFKENNLKEMKPAEKKSNNMREWGDYKKTYEGDGIKLFRMIKCIYFIYKGDKYFDKKYKKIKDIVKRQRLKNINEF